MPTMEEVLAYLAIDYTDAVTTANVTRAMDAARYTLYGSVGEDVLDLIPSDPRVKELVLLYTDDLYSNRGVSTKVSGATRRLVSDMEMQLRMELRRIREGVLT